MDQDHSKIGYLLYSSVDLVDVPARSPTAGQLASVGTATMPAAIDWPKTIASTSDHDGDRCRDLSKELLSFTLLD